MKTHLKLFYIFFSIHVEYHTPIEILSRVQFCTVFVPVSTKTIQNWKIIIIIIIKNLVMLYSSFVMNILEKFPGAATGDIYKL